MLDEEFKPQLFHDGVLYVNQRFLIKNEVKFFIICIKDKIYVLEDVCLCLPVSASLNKA